MNFEDVVKPTPTPIEEMPGLYVARVSSDINEEFINILRQVEDMTAKVEGETEKDVIEKSKEAERTILKFLFKNILVDANGDRFDNMIVDEPDFSKIPAETHRLATQILMDRSRKNVEEGGQN